MKKIIFSFILLIGLMGCTNQKDVNTTQEELVCLTEQIEQLKHMTKELSGANLILEKSLKEAHEKINILEDRLEEQTRQITYRVGTWALNELEHDRTYKDTLMDSILTHELNRKTIYGYVTTMDNEHIVIDEVQRIFPDDVEMIAQLDLGSDKDFFQRGYYTYNKAETTTSYPIEAFTDFFHFDGENWFLIPTEKNIFIDRMIKSKELCQLLLINGRVFRIEADSRL